MQMEIEKQAMHNAMHNQMKMEMQVQMEQMKQQMMDQMKQQQQLAWQHMLAAQSQIAQFAQVAQFSQQVAQVPLQGAPMPPMPFAPNHQAGVPSGVPQYPQPAAPPPGGALAMARDQGGSLQLQEAFKTMTAKEMHAVIEELTPHLNQLITHPFGNYIASKLVALPAAQAAMADAISGRVVELMQDARASRVVQAAFEVLPEPTVKALIDELRTHVVETAMTTNGSWSVVSAFKRTRSSFIVEEVAPCLAAVSSHQHGTRVVQRMLPEAAAQGVELQVIFDALMHDVDLMALASHLFGNYVVQHALRAATAAQRSALIEKLLPSLPVISTSRGGSNVAETILHTASAEQLVCAEKLLRGQNLEAHNFGRHVMSTLSKVAAH